MQSDVECLWLLFLAPEARRLRPSRDREYRGRSPPRASPPPPSPPQPPKPKVIKLKKTGKADTDGSDDEEKKAGIGMKSLEEIQREKALLSMRRNSELLEN